MTALLRSGVRPVVRTPVVLAVCGVAAQIAYPLAHGSLRDVLTAAVVVLLAAAAVAHATATRGAACAWRLVGVVTLPAFAVEVIGVHTGVPFGTYRYGAGLGPSVLGVPLVVPLAWTMLAWPAAIAARTLATSFGGRVVAGTWALAAADLFLDPQLVADGHWRWTYPDPHLPGVPDVPLTNYAGWLVTSLLLSVLVQLLLARTPDADDRLPAALYVWFWAGWTLALAAFLDLPAAAVWGAIGMGTVAVPLAIRMLRR